MKKPGIYLIFSLLFFINLKAQPFVDILAFNSQHFYSNYNNGTNKRLNIRDHFLNVFVPVKLSDTRILLLRFNAERLEIKEGDLIPSRKLYSLSFPVGMQMISGDQAWKYTGIIVPKINSDFIGNLNNDCQLGGIALVTRVVRQDLQFKFGLYYNREFFGNFFMPLAGVDWRINDRFQIYGVLPSNYRIEYKLNRKWNAGVGFRSFQRSYRLSNNGNDFTRVRENQVKIYMEGFICKKLLMTCDVYRSLGYKFTLNDFGKKNQGPSVPAFNDNIGFTIGLAYRVITTKPQKEMEPDVAK